jgi:hypothetical protein
MAGALAGVPVVVDRVTLAGIAGRSLTGMTGTDSGAACLVYDRIRPAEPAPSHDPVTSRAVGVAMSSALRRRPINRAAG